MSVFRELVTIKTGKYKPTHQDLKTDFQRMYNTLDDIAKIIDKFQVQPWFIENTLYYSQLP